MVALSSHNILNTMAIALEAFKFITALQLPLFVKFVALKEWNQACDQNTFL